MAATTINQYTDQATKINNTVTAYAPLKPNELSGRVRIAFFYWKPTAAVAAGQNIALTKLPTGARILGGKALSNAFVATSTMDVGLAAADGGGYLDKNNSISDAVGYLAAALAVATAGAYDFGHTIALNNGFVTEKETWLTATLNTAGMDGSADILQGYVMYVVD